MSLGQRGMFCFSVCRGSLMEGSCTDDTFSAGVLVVHRAFYFSMPVLQRFMYNRTCFEQRPFFRQEEKVINDRCSFKRSFERWKVPPVNKDHHSGGCRRQNDGLSDSWSLMRVVAEIGCAVYMKSLWKSYVTCLYCWDKECRRLLLVIGHFTHVEFCSECMWVIRNGCSRSLLENFVFIIVVQTLEWLWTKEGLVMVSAIIVRVASVQK